MNENENSYVDESYINVAITYTEEDKHKLFEAAKCYVTQFTNEELNELIESVSADKANTKYFRRFSNLKGVMNGFWFEK